MSIIAYIFKNIGLLLGILESCILLFGQALKVAAGIVHFTPSRKDDEWVNSVEKLFEQKIIPMFKKVKKFLYNMKKE